jgi:hypothetical protein
MSVIDIKNRLPWRWKPGRCPFCEDGETPTGEINGMRVHALNVANPAGGLIGVSVICLRDPSQHGDFENGQPTTGDPQ